MRRDKIEINGLESILIETNGNHLFRKGCLLAPIFFEDGSIAPHVVSKGANGRLVIANLIKVASGVLDLRRLKMEFSEMKIQKFV